MKHRKKKDYQLGNNKWTAKAEKGIILSAETFAGGLKTFVGGLKTFAGGLKTIWVGLIRRGV